MLRIGEELSNRYRDQIQGGCEGLKPGWARICFHYTMDETDFEYICEAVEFLADQGHLFLPLYRFSMETGAWSHEEEPPPEPARFGIEAAWSGEAPRLTAPPPDEARAEYARYLEEARRWAGELARRAGSTPRPLPGIDADLVYFDVVEFEAPTGRAR